MQSKPRHIVVIIACLLSFVGFGLAQEEVKKPQTLITESKAVVGRLRISKDRTIKVNGAAVFKVTQCNADRTLTGELTIQIDEPSLKELDEKLRKTFLSAITLQNVIADFAKGTECPTVKLGLPTVYLAINGETLRFDRFTLDLKETKQEVSRILCYYVSCRIECRHVRRINELLFGLTDN